MVTPLYCILNSELGVVSWSDDECFSMGNIAHMVISILFLPLYLGAVAGFTFLVAPRNPMSKAYQAAPMTRIQLVTFVVNCTAVALAPFITHESSPVKSTILLGGLCVMYLSLSIVYVKSLPYYRKSANCVV